MGSIACVILGVLLLAAVATSISKGTIRGSRGGVPLYEVKRSSNPIGFWAGLGAFAGIGLLCLWAALR